MNQNNLNEIVHNYIDQFEIMNGPSHEEYYKWQIAAQFKPMMDHALSVSDDELPDALLAVKKLTANLIDSYTQPFYGLSEFARKDPKAVRQMFLDLYQDDGGDLEIRQNKIVDFLHRSHNLRDRLKAGSYLYNDDFHSVTSYLFLYDPDHNYIYKATHAREFADCIEFYDDWGYGENVNLDVYYRMCDEVADAAKNHAALMETDASRASFALHDNRPLHPDKEKHILVFDLIYCCSSYGLFDGISYEKPDTKARQLMKERKEKATQLYEQLTAAKEKLKEYEAAMEDVNQILREGAVLRHKLYGEGTVLSNDGECVTVDFPQEGETELGTDLSVANGLITVDDEECAQRLQSYRDCLKKGSVLADNVAYLTRDFEPYSDYL